MLRPQHLQANKKIGQFQGYTIKMFEDVARQIAEKQTRGWANYIITPDFRYVGIEFAAISSANEASGEKVFH